MPRLLPCAPFPRCRRAHCAAVCQRQPGGTHQVRVRQALVCPAGCSHKRGRQRLPRRLELPHRVARRGADRQQARCKQQLHKWLMRPGQAGLLHSLPTLSMPSLPPTFTHHHDRHHPTHVTLLFIAAVALAPSCPMALCSPPFLLLPSLRHHFILPFGWRLPLRRCPFFPALCCPDACTVPLHSVGLFASPQSLLALVTVYRCASPLLSCTLESLAVWYCSDSHHPCFSLSFVRGSRLCCYSSSRRRHHLRNVLCRFAGSSHSTRCTVLARFQHPFIWRCLLSAVSRAGQLARG